MSTEIERLEAEIAQRDARITELEKFADEANAQMLEAFAERDARIAELEAALKAWPPSAGTKVQICRLGIYGKAYDAPGTCRAYTYTDQPDNLGAWRLGEAVYDAHKNRGGDHIDCGLVLLKLLQERGLGVFEIATASEQKESE